MLNHILEKYGKMMLNHILLNHENVGYSLGALFWETQIVMFSDRDSPVRFSEGIVTHSAIGLSCYPKISQVMQEAMATLG